MTTVHIFTDIKILKYALLHIHIALDQICLCYDIACDMPYWIHWKSEEFQILFLVSGPAATCKMLGSVRNCTARNTVQYNMYI
jgi:hypothetical protein